MSGHEASVYDIRLTYAPRIQCPANVRTKSVYCVYAFYSNCPYKSDKFARHPETFSIGPLPWPIPKYTYFIYETFSVSRRKGPFLLCPNIIDKCLFPPCLSTLRGHADDGDTLYVLNTGRLDMRNICDWRAICLSGVAAVRKKSWD